MKQTRKRRTNLSYQALKKSACKRKQESPEATKDSKQHVDHSHIPSPKQNRNLHKKMKCIFPIPMNNIYRKEQEVSSKENNVESNARNTNTLWMQRENNNHSDCRIYNSWPLEASHSRCLRRPGRVFNLCPWFVLDLNHSDQWNTLLSAGGEIF